MSRTSAETIREFTRVFKNEHDVDGIDALFAPDFKHNFRMPVAPGLNGFKDIGRMMNAAFPDVVVQEEALLVAGDYVIERSSAHATHLGQFMGIPATGRRVTWSEIHLYRLRQSHIVEHWVELSTLELLSQVRKGHLASTHEILIQAPAEAVFRLLATREGIAQWWTDDADANPNVGYVNRLRFDCGAVEMPFRVDRIARPRTLEWTCVTGDKVPGEWVGTRIVAAINTQPDGGTQLAFAHEGWQPGSRTYALCNSTWGELLHRLRAAAEGKNRGPRFTRLAASRS